MLIYKTPLTKPYFTEDELKEIQSVLDSGWVSQGPKCSQFERDICKTVGATHAVAVSNCTSALFLALTSLGIGEGDDVVVADFSFPATGLSVLHTGATPKFCDVDQTTYNLNPENLEACITPDTKAIIPVHTFGNPCDMDSIMEIARFYELYVIEDAACAFGSIYNGKHIGTFGDIGCFSFHARKGITTGEGGAIVTNSKEIADNIRKIATFGVGPTYGRTTIPRFESMGYNFKMSDIAAAIGVAQIKKLDYIINQRRHIARIYDELLDFRLISQAETRSGFHIYQSYVCRNNMRSKIILHLESKGIEAGIGTYAQHMQPCFNTSTVCETSRRLYNTTLSLPIFPELKEETITQIAEVIQECI